MTSPYRLRRGLGRGNDALLGLTLVVVGLMTLIWWVLRLKGQTRQPTRLLVAGRAALLVAVVAGVLELVPEVSAALGVT